MIKTVLWIVAAVAIVFMTLPYWLPSLLSLQQKKNQQITVSHEEIIISYVDEHGKEHKVIGDEILVAAGKKPNTKELLPQRVNLELNDNQAIIVNSFLQTSQSNIFAVGDVVNLSLRLEPTAGYEGTLAAENALLGTQKSIEAGFFFICLLFRECPKFIPKEVIVNKSECYDLCLKCLTTCDRCAFECCANTASHSECLKACLTCADACTSCIRASSRGSKLAGDFLSLCIKACEACAEECEKHDEALCKECADICRQCAEKCKQCCKECCKKD